MAKPEITAVKRTKKYPFFMFRFSQFLISFDLILAKLEKYCKKVYNKDNGVQNKNCNF